MRGTIRDDQGLPVARAKVTYITELGQQIDYERTDVDGSYSIVLPQAGAYRVTVQVEGSDPVESLVSAAPDVALQELTI